MNILERFEDKVERIPEGGCHVWMSTTDKDGYGKFWYEGDQVRAHRMAHKLYIGDIPEGQHVLHHCDNPCCVNPLHLYAGTEIDNHRDKVNRNRAAKGVEHGRCKLTEDQVRAIRASDDTITNIMKKYNMSRGAIFNIRNNRTWQWLT